MGACSAVAVVLLAVLLAASVYVNTVMHERFEDMRSRMNDLGAARDVSAGGRFLARTFAVKFDETGDKWLHENRFYAWGMYRMAEQLGAGIALLGTNKDYYTYYGRREMLTALARSIVMNAEAVEVSSKYLGGAEEEAVAVAAKVAQVARKLKDRVAELMREK